MSTFPEELRIEYEQRIETCFQRVKYISLRMWNRDAKYVREINELEKIKRELVQHASQLLMNSSSRHHMYSLNAKVEAKFRECGDKYRGFLEQMFDTSESLERKLIVCHNQHLKHVKYDDQLMSSFERVPPIQGSIDSCLASENSPKFEDSWFSHSDYGRLQLKRLKRCWELKKCDHSTSWKKRNAFVQWIMSIVYDKIIPEVNGRIDKPFVDDSHVRHAFNSIYKHLFVDQQSPIVHCSTSNTLHQFNMEQLTRDVLVQTLSAMLDFYVNLRDTELQAKRDEYEKLSTRLRTRIETDIKCMHDSNESGTNVAKQVVASIVELLVKESDKRAQEQISRVIFDRLKNPEELIDHAFKTSFEALDYQAVYKYVRDVVGYCTEVSEELTAPRVKCTIDSERRRVEENVQLVIHTILTRLNRNAFCSASTVHSFLDELRKTSKSNDDDEDDEVVQEMIERILSKCKTGVVERFIQNAQCFQRSFGNEVKTQAFALQSVLRSLVPVYLFSSNGYSIKSES